jgi:hypothetical protein
MYCPEGGAEYIDGVIECIYGYAEFHVLSNDVAEARDVLKDFIKPNQRES